MAQLVGRRIVHMFLCNLKSIHSVYNYCKYSYDICTQKPYLCVLAFGDLNDPTQNIEKKQNK